VISVIGRFLEHSRLFYFRNGAQDPLDGTFLIGSADWMYRNLLARLEVFVPIESRGLREKLWEILQIMLRDHRQAWELQPDGVYRQRMPEGADAASATHQVLMDLTRQRCTLAPGTAAVAGQSPSSLPGVLSVAPASPLKLASFG